MVIIEVPRQRLPQVPGAENHEMVQAFPPYGPDQAFRVRILPRASGSSEHFFDTQCRDAAPHVLAVDAVSVADHEPDRVPIGKRFHNLLRCPDGGRVIRNPKAQLWVVIKASARQISNLRRVVTAAAISDTRVGLCSISYRQYSPG